MLLRFHKLAYSHTVTCPLHCEAEVAVGFSLYAAVFMRKGRVEKRRRCVGWVEADPLAHCIHSEGSWRGGLDLTKL